MFILFLWRFTTVYYYPKYWQIIIPKEFTIGVKEFYIYQNFSNKVPV